MQKKYICAVFLMANYVCAHIMPSNKGTVAIKKNVARVILSIPADAFFKYDNFPIRDYKLRHLKKYKAQMIQELKDKVSILQKNKKCQWQDVFVNFPKEYKAGTQLQNHELIFFAVSKLNQSNHPVQFKFNLFDKNYKNIEIRFSYKESKEIIKSKVIKLNQKNKSTAF